MENFKNVKKIDFKKNPPEILQSDSSILNKETLEYINALINLEISVLDKNAISEKALRQLNELKFFRDLIIYNLYYRAKKLIEKDRPRKFKSNINSFSIEYRKKGKVVEDETDDLLRFSYDEMILSLYRRDTQTPEEMIIKRNQEIAKIQKRLKQLQNIEMPNNMQEIELEGIMRRLQLLRELTDKKIIDQFESSKPEYEEQQIITEQILTNTNLKPEDFEEIDIKGGKKFLIKKYPHASIYIHK